MPTSQSKLQIMEEINNNVKNNILSIDIGGSSIKAVLLDEYGEMISDYIKSKTPNKAEPKEVLEIILELVNPIENTYDRVSIGFPWVCKIWHCKNCA